MAIFIVGLPRSGTTLIYRALAAHPDLAWISPATRKWATSYGICRLRMLFYNSRLPVEGARLWRKFRRMEDDLLLAEHVTSAGRRYYRALADNQMRLHKKSRFLAKHPRNGLRIPYFSDIFPDIFFLHVIRDGRAVAESILRYRIRSGSERAWWGMKPPGWKDQRVLTVGEQIGWQWAESIRLIRQFGNARPAGGYMEIRYETFCDAPRETLLAVADACGLPVPEGLWSELDRFTSQNAKWQAVLTPDCIARIESAAGPQLRALNYL